MSLGKIDRRMRNFYEMSEILDDVLVARARRLGLDLSKRMVSGGNRPNWGYYTLKDASGGIVATGQASEIVSVLDAREHGGGK